MTRSTHSPQAPPERMARTRRTWFTWLALLIVADPALAGVLHGELPATSARAGDRPGDAVVWVESISERAEHQLTRAPFRWFWQARRVTPLPRLTQAGGRYVPHVQAVATGGALVIRNRDRVWHGAFSVSPAAPLEIGKRAPGGTDTVRFAVPGVVAVRCDIHPDESAFVVVTPNHAAARPDRLGRWQLPDLPAGRYVVHAWHPAHGGIQREVELGARGTTRVPLHW